MSLFNFPISSFLFPFLQPKNRTTLKKNVNFNSPAFELSCFYTSFNFGASGEHLFHQFLLHFHPFLLHDSIFLVSTSTPVKASPLFSNFNFVFTEPLHFFFTALCFSFNFNSGERFPTPFRFQLCFHRTSPFLLHSSPLAVSYPSSLKSSE